MYGGEGTGNPFVGYWYRFGDKCTGTLQEANSIPKLCCTAVPQCAWCSYCGGDYPEAVARKFNRGRPSNFKMLDMECKNNFGFREQSGEGYLCCRDKRNCKLCEGNCGGNYNQVGYIADKDDKGYWGVFGSPYCNENNIDSNPNFQTAADISLCCLD